jgi:hypothetical protein
MTPGDIDAVTNDLLSAALTQMIREHERGLARTIDEAEISLSRIDADRAKLRHDARLRDFSQANPLISAVAERLGHTPD